MLSSIHPLGEAGRGQRWWLTVTAHVVGSTIGGGVVALALGALGRAAGGLGIGLAARLVAVALVALVAVAADGRRWPSWLWRGHRQVNEDWLTRYRGWVYGGGFGVQLGMGMTTIVTAATLYALAALAFAMGSLTAAMILGSAFGLARGLTVLWGWRIDGPEALVQFHRGLQRSAPWGRVAAVAGDLSILLGVLAVLVRGA